ncbi:MAG: manganese efflux pump [Bacilli bacterium]|nr:manganese efflux pump [Bacilli bacterium]
MIDVIIISILLGVGLAMDACAVSMANGLNEPKMKISKVLLIAGCFGVFQGLMPFIGYLVGMNTLTKIEWIIPWVALALLSFIGLKMIIEGRKEEETEQEKKSLTFRLLIIQSIATSIDALTVGFTISNYLLKEAIACVLIIAFVTFIICILGIYIGKTFGTKLGNKAQILGGLILVLIGLEIFITGVFF